MELVVGEHRCTIRPDLGGRVTSLLVGGKEFLWMPEDTTPNQQGWIHGGIPFLFPFVGRVWHDQQVGNYCWQEQVYPMTLHGFTHRGNFTSTSKTQCQYVHRSDDHQMYPFDFDLLLDYRLNDTSLNLLASIVSKQALPIAPGFHPYFSAQFGQLGVKTNEKTLAFAVKEGRCGEETNWPQDPWSSQWQNLIFQSPENLQISTKKGVHKLSLSWSNDVFPWVVSWTEQPTKYLCIEPWAALPDAVHAESFTARPPHVTHRYEMTLSW